MRYIIMLLCTVLTVSLYAQQIEGYVKNASGSPVAFANVILKGTSKGATTDEAGYYRIENMAPGKCLVQVSAIGFSSQNKEIETVTGQQLTLDFQLTENFTELQAVEFMGRKETSYKSDYSFAATKTQTAIKDIPQTISTVTKELITDQQSYRLKDVVKSVAGINQFSVYDDITIRGFRNSGSNGRLLNGLRTNNNFWQSPLLINIERVEVIKGPASAMFSNTNPGGTINMVTKKPLEEEHIGLNFTVGSWNTLRTTVDFTGPLTDDKKVLYRLNLGYENSESFRDYTPAKTMVVAPTVTFIPTENTRFNIDLVYTQNNGVLDRGRPVRKGEQDLLATPFNLTLTQPGDFLNLNDLSLSFSLNQKITKNISFNSSYMKYRHGQALQEHRIQSYINPDSIELRFSDRFVKAYFDNVTNYLTGKFITGQLDHQVLVGYDYIYYDNEFIEQNAVGAAGGLENFSLKNPKNFKRPVANYILRPASYNRRNFYSTHGLYVQEQVSFGKFKALLGLRQEYYRIPKEDTNIKKFNKEDLQSYLLPRVGLIYSVLPNINIYGNYSEGYEPQGATSNLNPNAGGPFDPLIGKLMEVGAKGEFFGRGLFAGLSVYEITQNNILVSANNPAQPELLEQRGQERARGVEFETAGQLLPNLSVNVTYAYNDAQITESNNELLIGLEKENAPLHNSSSWVKYTFNKGKLAGLGVAIGHSQNSVRRTFATYPNEPTRYLMLPTYVVFNSAIFHSVDKFRLAININNLTDEKWFAGGYNFERNFPGAPRNYLLSFGYTF